MLHENDLRETQNQRILVEECDKWNIYNTGIN